MKIVILGAAGHIGKHSATRLESLGHEVIRLSREYDISGPLEPPLSGSWEGQIDSVICCVGHCPAGGFRAASTIPISQFSAAEMNREIEMHVWVPFLVFRHFMPLLKNGGSFIFMSSLSTRLLNMPRITRPKLHIYHHVAVIAAENALIEGMRMDPAASERGILIHRVTPPAIEDSPFHSGSPKFNRSVTTEQVVSEILKRLKAKRHCN